MTIRTFIMCAGLVCILLYSCNQSDTDKGEALAKKYCSSCHLFPEPGLLDKKTWANGIMPKMAFRMGLDFSEIAEISGVERNVIMTTIPDSPTIDEDDWELIKKYYQTYAPDSLTPVRTEMGNQTQFKVEKWKQPGKSIPQLTFARHDSTNQFIWAADRASSLFKLSHKLKPIDSLDLSSPASAMLIHEDTLLVLTMGIMDPNDQAKGSLWKIFPNGERNLMIDSLRRPVFMEEADLNRDGLKDFIFCEFGNYTGGVAVFQNLGRGKFKRHEISQQPGARKVIVKDFDGDGLKDIMALITQGNEQLTLFSNTGNFRFRITSLLRFPPVYGSSYFELADFNQDGKDDILYSNGDNADFSSILKPYHGLRIYLNIGVNQYKEAWFFPLDGASQTISRDFDKDGDMDIAAISFFPDLKASPERGFAYFQNSGNLNFTATTTRHAASARWMTMHSGDIDGDNDEDLLLAALNFDKSVPIELGKKWTDSVTSVLLLRNILKD